MRDKTKDIEKVTFLKVCGDCGRKFKDTFVLPDNKKDCMKIMSLYYKKYDLACRKCSMKHDEDKKSSHVKPLTIRSKK